MQSNFDKPRSRFGILATISLLIVFVFSASFIRQHLVDSDAEKEKIPTNK